MVSRKVARGFDQNSLKSSDERGQASIALVAIFVIMALVAISVSVVARRAVERAVARNGADAIALSALVGHDGSPADIAARNGIDDFSLAVEGSRATASVTVGKMSAQATAKLDSFELDEAPAIAAVMARLAQLVERSAIPYTVVLPDPYLATGSPSFTVEVEAESVSSVLEHGQDLGLCRPDEVVHPSRFRLC